MDKSFNDQELSDIMKEIEALEEEFSADEDSSKVEASSIMEDLAEMEEEQSIPVTNREETTVLPFAKKEISQPTKATSSMSFKVQGDLNLELHFEVGGKNKTRHQVKSQAQAFLVKDDTLISGPQMIPLYYFGFLY